MCTIEVRVTLKKTIHNYSKYEICTILCNNNILARYKIPKCNIYYSNVVYLRTKSDARIK